MSNNISITLYHATWCGHCKNLMPEWKKLEKELDELHKKGKFKVCYKIVEEGDMCNSEREIIRGFPTIKITKNGKTYEYKGKRTADAMLKELTSSDSSVIKSQKGGSKIDKYYDKYISYKKKYLKLKTLYI